MAGTLTVQNIEGPSSGDNANKIIIPSGQTLYAPGHVIQAETFSSGSSVGTVSSSSYTDILSCSFTTKEDGSLVVVNGAVPLYINDTAGAWTGSAYIQLVRDGTSVAGFEHPGPKNTVDEFSSSNALAFSEVLSSAGTYTYKVQVALTAAGGSLQYNRTTNGALSSTRLTFMEIAQ